MRTLQQIVALCGVLTLALVSMPTRAFGASTETFTRGTTEIQPLKQNAAAEWQLGPSPTKPYGGREGPADRRAARAQEAQVQAQAKAQAKAQAQAQAEAQAKAQAQAQAEAQAQAQAQAEVEAQAQAQVQAQAQAQAGVR